MTADSLAWARRVGLLDASAEWIEAMGTALNAGSFSGWLYPMTDDPRVLQIGSDLVLWVTALDDELEVLAPTLSYAERAAMVSSIGQLVRGGTSGHPMLARYVAAFRDINARLRDLVPTHHYGKWTERFWSSFDRVVIAVLTLEPLAAERWQDLDFYRRTRPDACWVPPFMSLVEIAYDCYLPSELALAVKRFEELGCLLFSLFNDVASLAADDTGMPVGNAVLIHRQATGCTTDESIAAIMAWHHEIVEEFERRGAELERRAGDDRPLMTRYVHSMQALVAGVTHWQLHVGRYSEASRQRAVLHAVPPASADSTGAMRDAQSWGSMAHQRLLAVYGVVMNDLEADLTQLAQPEHCRRILDGLDRALRGGRTEGGTLLMETVEPLIDLSHPEHDVYLSQARLLGWLVEILRTYLRGDVDHLCPARDQTLFRLLLFRLLRRRFAATSYYPDLVKLFERALDTTAPDEATYGAEQLPVQAALTIIGRRAQRK
jgi:hypothetical protein